MVRPNQSDNATGIALALVITLLWGGSLALLLQSPFQFDWWTVPSIFWQTFLYTGLFITAHDSMHGSISPSYSEINNFLGGLAAALYALFPISHLRKKHRMHHKHAGTSMDPDHHGAISHPIAWYLTFLKRYISFKQIIGMAILFNIAHHLLGIPVVNLLVFWVLPACLSTIQLFVFGNYLPHRTKESETFDRHHTRSNTYSEFWSLITCYHFGYHWEHHEYPYVPWWKLPRLRRLVQHQQKSLTQCQEVTQAILHPGASTR